uniref:Uncharacterized protein n=1 Tax=Arundo donax TaxID=35708 RepID=A0A0A8Y319_ARUDO
MRSTYGWWLLSHKLD